MNAPANGYEAFLMKLPEERREAIAVQLRNSKLATDHPVFAIMADVLGLTPSNAERRTDPDFVEEAELLSTLGRQILEDFGKLPKKIIGQINEELVAPLQVLIPPASTLNVVSSDLRQAVDTLQLFLPSRRPRPETFWRRQLWRLVNIWKEGWLAIANSAAWITAGAAVAGLTTAGLLYGWNTISDHCEAEYQAQLASLQAGSSQDKASITELATAGITLNVERAENNDGVFVVFKGASRAAQPINSQEGLAVQVWP